MREQFIKFIDSDVDGCGTNVEVIVRINGKKLKKDTIDRVENAISNYKEENKNEWDTDSCVDVATKQLESEGYKVDYIFVDTEIYF